MQGSRTGLSFMPSWVHSDKSQKHWLRLSDLVDGILIDDTYTLYKFMLKAVQQVLFRGCHFVFKLKILTNSEKDLNLLFSTGYWEEVPGKESCASCSTESAWSLFLNLVALFTSLLVSLSLSLPMSLVDNVGAKSPSASPEVCCEGPFLWSL